MPIRVVCASCEASFRVADDYAGRRGKCPKCAAVVVVPSASTPLVIEVPPPVADDEETGTYDLAGSVRKPVVGRSGLGASRRAVQEGAEVPVALSEVHTVTTATRTSTEILTAFEEPIAPVRPTWLYRFWILVVAGVMLLLPLIYLALIVLVGVAVFFHATNNTGILSQMRGRHQGQAVLLIYVAPILAGVFLIVFMIKPLFARKGAEDQSRALDPTKEPLLFAFVDGVCSTVGARTPRRITIDCQVNASARLEGGPFSFFNRNLELKLGLPLVAGTSLRQFAGVLAHEFGHFSQGAGMRLTSMIYSINRWFSRVVYERDAWDENLETWSRGGDIRVMAIVGLFRLVVWLTRRILWVLMIVGQVVSSFLMRQMEFDADRYEARMVGGEVFESTTKRLQVLGVATQGAFYDLNESWREGRLADNLPKLILVNVAQLSPETIAAIDESVVSTRKTGIFDTHPADKDRIARAHDEDTDGVFHLDGPATDVFRDFDSLCRSATYTFYKATFGKHNVDKDKLLPVSELVLTQTASQEGNQALERFFQGAFNPFRPLMLPNAAPGLPDDLAVARKTLADARHRMLTTLGPYREALQRSEDLRVEAIKVAAATAMLKAEYKPKPAEFGIPKARIEDAVQTAQVIVQESETLDATLSVRESAAVRRLHAALSLLADDEVAADIPDFSSWREEVDVLYAAGRHIGRLVVPVLGRTMQAQQALLGVLGQWQNDQQNPKIHNAVMRAARILADNLTELHRTLGGNISYPFDHAAGDVSLAKYALPLVPANDDVGELLNAAHSVLDKMIPLHVRIIGRLSLAAEEVEKTLGMEPLLEVIEA